MPICWFVRRSDEKRLQERLWDLLLLTSKKAMHVLSEERELIVYRHVSVLFKTGWLSLFAV